MVLRHHNLQLNSPSQPKEKTQWKNQIALQLAWRGVRPTTRPTQKTTLYYVESTARLNSCPIETIGRKESHDENVRTNPKAAQKNLQRSDPLCLQFTPLSLIPHGGFCREGGAPARPRHHPFPIFHLPSRVLPVVRLHLLHPSLLHSSLLHSISPPFHLLHP